MASTHLAVYLCCFMAISLSTNNSGCAARRLLETSGEVGLPKIQELPKPELPILPEIHFPEIPKPELPILPEIHFPEIPKPELPTLPDIHEILPNHPDFPKLEIPKIDVPKLPEISFPTVTTVPNEKP